MLTITANYPPKNPDRQPRETRRTGTGGSHPNGKPHGRPTQHAARRPRRRRTRATRRTQPDQRTTRTAARRPATDGANPKRRRTDQSRTAGQNHETKTTSTTKTRQTTANLPRTRRKRRQPPHTRPTQRPPGLSRRGPTGTPVGRRPLQPRYNGVVCVCVGSIVVATTCVGRRPASVLGWWVG